MYGLVYGPYEAINGTFTNVYGIQDPHCCCNNAISHFLGLGVFFFRIKLGGIDSPWGGMRRSKN